MTTGIVKKSTTILIVLAAWLAVERLPVIGTTVTFVKFLLRIKGHLRDMRALQNHLYRVSKKVA